MMSLNKAAKVASIFYSIVAAAATTTNTADDESVASAPSFLKRELKVDDAVSSYSFSYSSCAYAYGGDGNGSIVSICTYTL